MAVIASPSSPLGWEARGVALHCLLQCLPHPNSPKYNSADDGVTFRAIAHHANNALLHFADALRKVNSGLEDDSELVLSAAARVCGNLRRFESLPEYGEAAGFPPPQFMEAMHDYLALWESREPDRLSTRPLFHQLRFRAMQKQVDAYRRGDRQRVRRVHLMNTFLTSRTDIVALPTSSPSLTEHQAMPTPWTTCCASAFRSGTWER